MFPPVVDYFHSGQRVCLVRRHALDSRPGCLREDDRSLFPSLDLCLVGRAGPPRIRRAGAARSHQEVVGGIQGAIVLALAIYDNAVYHETIASLRSRWRAILNPRRSSKPAIASENSSSHYAKRQRVATIKGGWYRPLMVCYRPQPESARIG